MDDERLKNPEQPFGKDYFQEQLERIKDIRYNLMNEIFYKMQEKLQHKLQKSLL